MIRPLGDWTLIALDALPKHDGLIHLLASGEERIRTGRVLRAGPGRWVQPDHDKKGPQVFVKNPLQEGEHVAFFRENFETKAGRQIQGVINVDHDKYGHELGLVRAGDVLFVITGKVKVSA